MKIIINTQSPTVYGSDETIKIIINAFKIKFRQLTPPFAANKNSKKFKTHTRGNFLIEIMLFHFMKNKRTVSNTPFL